MSTNAVRLGLLGYGTVGAALGELLAEQRVDIAELTGLEIEITRIAVRDLSKARSIPAEIVLTDDPAEVVSAEDVDIVVELVGGVEEPLGWVTTALAAQKPVVTGNKALLAAHGAELFALARHNRTELFFEASVAGGIPLMRALQHSLRGEPIRRVMGIVNGTTNYMLSKMTDEGASYDQVLAEAQRLGYAEADPTADVEGLDAQAKAAIIATVALGASVHARDVYPTEGITRVTRTDIANARRLGYVIKLLAIVERIGDTAPYEVAARVHPTMVPQDHPLASVRGSFNAVFIDGDAVGELMLYGHGAGGRPTASAVLGDVIAAARSREPGKTDSFALNPALAEAKVRPADESKSAFYLCLHADDRPGVLSEIANVFAVNAVSIRSMEQQGLRSEATIIFITHEATEAAMAATVEKLGSLPCVLEVGALYRVIEPL